MLRRDSFLRTKLVGIRPQQIIFEQTEAAVVGIVGWIPTFIGMLIRNFAYRLLGMKITGFCFIQPNVTLVNMRRLRVGKNFGCNTGTYINAIGGISMGDDVLIGSNVTISSGKHEIEGRERSVFSRPTVLMPITFGDDVWLGAGASVLPGIHIADGTVVGANSVVTKSTAPYSVVVGIPARVSRFRL
jgi:acetyltransferase-like isoleucine patch superfamily enzyme